MTHVLMQHTTDADKLALILRHGLEPRDTVRHNYPDMVETCNAGIKRVYVKDLTKWPWSLPGGGGDRQEVVLYVDVAGLPLEEDPEVQAGYRIDQTVEPSRLRYAGTWDDVEARVTEQLDRDRASGEKIRYV